MRRFRLLLCPTVGGHHFHSRLVSSAWQPRYVFWAQRGNESSSHMAERDLAYNKRRVAENTLNNFWAIVVRALKWYLSHLEMFGSKMPC